MISSEMPELIGLCDRILVLHEGKIAGQVENDLMTEEEIMKLASGIACQSTSQNIGQSMNATTGGMAS